MNLKKRIIGFGLGVAVMAGLVCAEEFRFKNSGGDKNWTNPANWICKKKSAEKPLPGAADEAKIGEATARITTEVTVGYLKNGNRQPGKVVIDGGTLHAVGRDMYNSVSYNAAGVLIITNGGSAILNTYFMVGFTNTPGGRVEIYDGTLRVADTYFHNKSFQSSEPIDTRTTLYKGGLLDVDRIELNAGVMNLAGGSLVVRQYCVQQIEQWVSDGRIVAMGGAQDWKIKTAVDPASGHTVVVAEPSPVSAAAAVADPPPAGSTDVVEAGNEEPPKTGSNKLLMVLPVAALCVLLAFFLYILRKKSRREKPEPAQTYDF